MPLAIPTTPCPATCNILETATLLGARILEKHFSHDKTLPGNDHYHAMDKEDLKHFYKRLNATLASVGSMNLRAPPAEEPARQHARRSLVTARAFLPVRPLPRQTLRKASGPRHFAPQF